MILTPNDVIQQWIIDLNAPPDDFPKFNMDFEIRKTVDDSYEGDAALFILWRFLTPTDDPIEYMSHTTSVAYLHKMTSLPLIRCSDLLVPSMLYTLQYDTSLITSQQFASILVQYLETGVVDWNLALTDFSEKGSLHGRTHVL